MECSDIISLRLDNGEQGVRHNDSIDDIIRDSKPNKYGGFNGFGEPSNEPYQGPYYSRDFNLRNPGEYGPSFDHYNKVNRKMTLADSWASDGTHPTQVRPTYRMMTNQRANQRINESFYGFGEPLTHRGKLNQSFAGFGGK